MMNNTAQNISIGILAYNESNSIAKTLESLFQQSIFCEPVNNENIEIIAVPNGCTDNTAEICRITLEKLAKESPHSRVYWKVCEVEQAGKSNSWNLYVHEYSEPNANYILLMDADIQFLEFHTLRYLIDELKVKPEVWVTVDKPVKHIIFKEKKNLLDWLSIQGSQTYNHGICGQLYCSRGATLREIWLPPGLTIEDGFLRAIVLTNHFTGKEIFERIQRIPNTSHVFEAYTGILSWFHHEQCVIIGSSTNSILFEYLWANCSSSLKAGTLIEQNNKQNPSWAKDLLEIKIQEKGKWVIPKSYYFRRFRNLQKLPLSRALLKLPFAVLATLADWIVFIQANHAICKGKGLGYW
jgi:glycosyltransferase involved in cell wall biosynthesis